MSEFNLDGPVAVFRMEDKTILVRREAVDMVEIARESSSIRMGGPRYRSDVVVHVGSSTLSIDNSELNAEELEARWKMFLEDR